jgi:hypothetical protein
MIENQKNDENYINNIINQDTPTMAFELKEQFNKKKNDDAPKKREIIRNESKKKHNKNLGENNKKRSIDSKNDNDENNYSLNKNFYFGIISIKKKTTKHLNNIYIK